VRFSFKVWAQQVSWPDLRAVWTDADREGIWDAVWVNDHLYPPKAPARLPIMEAWTLLAALAAITDRLRFGAMVTANTFRNPALLAKMATTIDNVSNGRLEIGLGTGWHVGEHTDFGIPLPSLAERFERLGEACAIIDGLLTEDVFTFSGDHYQLIDAICEPKPVPRPRPPLIIGGAGPKRTIPLAARWADQWNFPDFDGDLMAFRRGVARLSEACQEIGRAHDDIEISAQMRYPNDLEATLDRVSGYIAEGADHVLVSFTPPTDPRLPPLVAEALAARFR
jgi:F420-dependent oxidoreductase-like protein